VRVVIGTSGLTAADYEEIDAKAQAQQLGVIAAGNFSITAALAKHFPSWRLNTCQAGKLLIMPAPGKKILQVERPLNWPKHWARWLNPSWKCLSSRLLALKIHGALLSRVARSILCDFPALSLPLKQSSACPMNG